MIGFWAVVPAAGVGRRMGAGTPKQYLPLLGRPVIEHALDRLVNHPRVAGVTVAIGADDAYWPDTAFAKHPRLGTVIGGAERVESVLNALHGLSGEAADEDWVLVHDAARPCLRSEDIDFLIDTLADDPVGGLLGVPVRDTMKRADPHNAIRATVDREGLWHAYTPQMFRLGMLREAITSALKDGKLVTDEASAIEHMGQAPKMVVGHRDNIKITEPLDLPLAEFFLSQQQLAKDST